MFAQDHWFLDKPPRLQTDSEEEHWDHQAVDTTFTHVGSSVHICELEDDDEYAQVEYIPDTLGATSSSKLSPERTSSLWNFPWWRIGATEEATENYLVKTRMKNREGEALLIDPGSPDNLCGDEWSERMRTAAVRAGRPNTTSSPMQNPLEVGGIGTGTQTATQKVVHRIGLANGREANYETPVLPRSGTPALLGQRSLRKLRALIDCFTGRLYFIGPGGYQIKLSPGSETHELTESHAGHLMLPCSDFQGSKATKETMQVMNSQVKKASNARPVSLGAGGVPQPRL